MNRPDAIVTRPNVAYKSASANVSREGSCDCSAAIVSIPPYSADADGAWGEPGETAYSILARYVRCTGVSPYDFATTLFGRGRVRINPFLPCHIARISQFAQRPAVDLLNQHTLFPLFAGFSSSENSSALREAMLGEDSLKVAYAARLPGNHFQFQHVIKYCTLCIEDDIRNRGFPTWQCMHQIPGVEACAKHQVWLEAKALPKAGWDSFSMPPDKTGTARKADTGSSEFAGFCSDLFRQLKNRKRRFDLVQAYQSGLWRNGLQTRSGRTRRLALLKKLDQVIARHDAATPIPTSDQMATALACTNKVRYHIYIHLWAAFALIRDARVFVKSGVPRRINSDAESSKPRSTSSPLDRLSQPGQFIAAKSVRVSRPGLSSHYHHAARNRSASLISGNKSKLAPLRGASQMDGCKK